MGARGPAKKPTELEILHGSPGHRKTDGKLKYEKSEECPKPPLFLDAIAKKEWKRLAPVVFKAGMLTKADIAIFAAYCASYSQWVTAEKKIQARKPDKDTPVLTFTTDKGYEQQIPEIGIANAAKKQMLTLAREFGLTPSARANMNAAAETEKKTESIMDFVKKKSLRAV